MKKFTHSAQKEHSSISRFIENMLDLLLACKARDEKTKKSKDRLKQLDESNPEYREILHDKRENNKMLLYIIVASLSVFIDFFLLYNALTIMCSQFNLPGILKILLPIFLVVVEIGVSYFSALKQQSGEYTSWLSKYLQYFVIAILIAFSLMIISFALQGYNPQFDGKSYLHFLLSSTITQIVLLIPSVLLHIWIIKNAEDVAEAIAYYKYKWERKILNLQIEKMETDVQKKYWVLFVKWAHNLVQRLDLFKRNYPDVDGGFERTMPADLIKAINMAMGKKILKYPDAGDVFIDQTR